MSSAETTPVCPICLDVIEPGANYSLTNCAIPHAFHTSCLIQLAVQPRPRTDAVQCPYCRADIFNRPDVHSIQLLRLVSKRDWPGMAEYQEAHPDARFDATIEAGDYNNSPGNYGIPLNVGMTPLHFAIRDHAPLAQIRHILEAYPAARFIRELCGFTPFEMLSETSANGNSWTEQEYNEVRDYLSTYL